MRYEGSVYRPPSEAYSLIVQVAVGCAHNRCTFCGMYKDKTFKVRDTGEILEDLDVARQAYRRVERIFLADGDVLALKMETLILILDHIQRNFPECAKISLYGSPRDVLRKTPADLRRLREKGLTMVYIGAESGSDVVLRNVGKGADRAEIIAAVTQTEAAGIQSSVTFISGLGGTEHWREHAVATGTMISLMEPSYTSLLTLMIDPLAPLSAHVRSGTFKLLSPKEVVEETILLLQNIAVRKQCVFRSNHASNYVALKGDLPGDKDRMISQLENVLAGSEPLKDEGLRML